jgi:type III secretory pathway component EscS
LPSRFRSLATKFLPSITSMVMVAPSTTVGMVVCFLQQERQLCQDPILYDTTRAVLVAVTGIVRCCEHHDMRRLPDLERESETKDDDDQRNE